MGRDIQRTRWEMINDGRSLGLVHTRHLALRRQGLASTDQSFAKVEAYWLVLLVLVVAHAEADW